jgi:glycine C-acetyltransferase
MDGQALENIRYVKSGLETLGLDVESGIITVKIGDPAKNGKAGQLLLDAGIYANPIIYPAVSLNDARIRMSIMATHTRDQLDKVLNAFEHVDQQLKISKAVRP